MPGQSIEHKKFPLGQGTAQLILIRWGIGFHLQANCSFHAVYYSTVFSSQALAWLEAKKDLYFWVFIQAITLLILFLPEIFYFFIMLF